MAEAMIEAYASPYVAFMFMKRRNPIIKREDALVFLKKHLNVITDAELPGFCLELIIHEGTEFGETNILTNKLCKLYDIDTNQIKKSAADSAKNLEEAKEEKKRESSAAKVSIKESSAAPQAPAGDKKPAAKETPAPAKRSEIKPTKDGKGVEFISAKGSKVTISAKGKTAEETKASGEALAQVAELFDTDKKAEAPGKKSRKKGAR